MGDWQVGPYRGPEEFDPVAVANAVGDFYIAGQAIYNRSQFRRAHRRAYDNMRLEPAGPLAQGGEGQVGLTQRTYFCSSKLGKRKRLSYAPVLKKLLSYSSFRTAILNNTFTGATAYRNQGTIQCRPQFFPDTGYPKVIEYPVFVFRLNVPNGYQSDVYNVVTYHYPVIAFRLTSTQDNSVAPYTWRWVPVGVNYTTPVPPLTQAMHQFDAPLYATKYRFNWATADILFSAPVTVSADMECNIVKFNDESFAPPDIYREGGTGTIVNYRENSGYQTAAPPEETENLMSAYYNTWMHNKLAHPLSKGRVPVGTQKPVPFSVLKRHRMTLTARNTTNADGAPIQYHHRVALKDYKWHGSGIGGDSFDLVAPTTDASVPYQIEGENIGVWIPPTQQRWLMVSMFNMQGLAKRSDAFSNATNPSFDIVLSNHFEYANEPDTQAPPQRSAEVMSLPDADIPGEGHFEAVCVYD